MSKPARHAEPECLPTQIGIISLFFSLSQVLLVSFKRWTVSRTKCPATRFPLLRSRCVNNTHAWALRNNPSSVALTHSTHTQTNGGHQIANRFGVGKLLNSKRFLQPVRGFCDLLACGIRHTTSREIVHVCVCVFVRVLGRNHANYFSFSRLDLIRRLFRLSR